MAKQTIFYFSPHTTTVGTDLDEYLEAGGGLSTSGGFIDTGAATQITLITRRTADTGTCTFQAFFEFLYLPDNVFYPVFDFAGVAVSGVSYADGVTDSAASYHALTIMRELPPAATPTAVPLTYNTIHKVYQAVIPQKVRFRIRSGGTTVSNTYSAQVQLHTFA